MKLQLHNIQLRCLTVPDLFYRWATFRMPNDDWAFCLADIFSESGWARFGNLNEMAEQDYRKIQKHIWQDDCLQAEANVWFSEDHCDRGEFAVAHFSSTSQSVMFRIKYCGDVWVER